MKSTSLFTVAVLQAFSTSANAWEHANRWSSGVDQQTYEQQMRLYEKVTTKIFNFVDQRKSVPQEKEYSFEFPSPSFLDDAVSVGECEKCLAGFKIAQNLFINEFAQTVVVQTFSDLCLLLVGEITYDACSLMVEQSAPTIMTELAELIISPQYSCQIEFGRCDKQWYTVDTIESYADRVLASKPESLLNDDFMNKMYADIAADQNERSVLKIIQFTDLHIDLEYKVGSNTVCDNVLCCREESGMATDPKYAAGPYGSVSFCDVPESVFDKMAEKINQLEPDTLFWTGDVAPHDQWNYSQDYCERYNKYFTDYLLENLNEWRIFVLEGNHDFGEVINSQNFDTTDPMIPFLADQWKQWLSEEALEEFKVNGFYTQKFATNEKVYDKINVIAVNTEATYNANYYLIGTRSDPGGQLAWLEQKLTEMEANGEIAILIGHHPPASESSNFEWSSRFRILEDRFQHIIRLSFFGHVHTEEHNAIKSWENNVTVGLNFWSGAMTTYSDSYPSFRRFILDEETMLPLAIETWRMDVYAESPEFVLDHELTQYYGMTDLSPQSFDSLSDRFAWDSDLALRYQQTKSQHGVSMPESCTQECRNEVHCDTQSSTYEDSRVCQGLKPIDLITDPAYALVSDLTTPWYTYSAHPRF